MKDVSIPEPEIMAGSESLPQILTLAHTSTQNQNGIIGPGQGQNVNCSETVSAVHEAQVTSQDKMQICNENENSTGTGLDRASSENNSVNHARRWIDATSKLEENGCHLYLKRLSENSSRLEKSIPNIPGKRRPGFPGPAPIDDFDSDSGPSSESDDKGSEYDPDNDDEYPEGNTVDEDTPDEEKSDTDVNEDVDDPSRGKNDAILRNDTPKTAPLVPVSVHVPRKVIWLNDSDSEDEVYLVPPNSAATVTAASASDMRRDDEESSESDSGSSDVVRLEMPNKRKPDSSSTGDNRDEEDTRKKPRQISECDSTTSTSQNMNVEDQPITLQRDIPVVPMDSHRDSITY